MNEYFIWCCQNGEDKGLTATLNQRIKQRESEEGLLEFTEVELQDTGDGIDIKPTGIGQEVNGFV